MMVVADTHVIVWNALAPEKLSKKARKHFDESNESDGIIFCDISLWEISMLIQKERLIIDIPFLEFIDLIKMANNYVFKPISPEIADLSATLSHEITADPADRLISATSVYLNAPLITADENLRHSQKVKTVW